MGQVQSTPAEVLFRPRVGKPVRMRPGLVADWFLDEHALWFLEPGGQGFGRRADCHRALVRFLEAGEWPAADADPVAHTVVWRFANECGDWFERTEVGP